MYLKPQTYFEVFDRMKDEIRFKGYNVVDVIGGKVMNENVRKQKKERKQ